MTQSIYYVGNIDDESEFDTIQAAIDQALLDGHTDVDTPAIIQIRPGLYPEDISLSRGISLRGFSARTFIQETVEPVQIQGTITCDLVFDGSLERTAVSIQGVEISPASGPGIVFTGTDPQILNLDTTTVNTADDVAVRVENTGAGSICQANDSVFRASAGNPAAAVEVSAGQFLALFSFIQKELAADTALAVIGGTCTSVFCRIFGDLDLDGGEAQFLNSFNEVDGQPIADIAAGGLLLASNATFIGSPAPGAGVLISGDGTYIQGTVTVMSGNMTFPGTLSAIDLPYGRAPGLVYVPGTPLDWLGTPPATVQEALDRIASAVVGLLGGGIP